MTWSVEADDDVEPLPAAVEVAAYRIVVEAVTNALRHSGAETCTVTLQPGRRRCASGSATPAPGCRRTPAPGVGLSSMRERAEELGGTCTVTSTPGSGTVVEVRLPLAGDAGSAR